MAANGAQGFVTTAAMLPAGYICPPGANVVAPTAGIPAEPALPPVPPIAPSASAKVVVPPSRPAMRWTNNTSGFVLRRLCNLIESGARADKGFKEKDVNQVAKLLMEYTGEEVTPTQVYNQLRKWRQRWGRISKLRDLSGALFDDEVKAIMLDPEHYQGHIKVF